MLGPHDAGEAALRVELARLVVEQQDDLAVYVGLAVVVVRETRRRDAEPANATGPAALPAALNGRERSRATARRSRPGAGVRQQRVARLLRGDH